VDAVREALSLLIQVSVLFFEVIGVLLIIFTGLKGVYILFTKKKPKKHWLKPLLMALSFLLFVEVLETVMAHSLNQLFVVGVLFALRAAMVLFINWEIQHDGHE
jgi:uncharacterized membrane protein